MRVTKPRLIYAHKLHANLVPGCYSTLSLYTIHIKIIRRIRAIGRNKSVGPDRVSGEILKLYGEAMILYLARLLDITMNNDALPGEWKTATVIPIHKVGVIDH